jgi:hypothetical protein
MTKPNINKVVVILAEQAIASAKSLQVCYSNYVMAHYHATGKLASGCDSKDLIEWIRINHPNMFNEKGVRNGNNN